MFVLDTFGSTGLTDYWLKCLAFSTTLGEEEKQQMDVVE